MRRLAILLSILAAAACGSANTPTGPGPAPSSATPSTTGAVIQGTVSGGASAAIFNTTNGAGAGLTVIVEGTNIQTTVNGLGQFALNNVPPGAIVLRFNGAGANATINIGTVTQGETVTLNVTVNGNTAEVTTSEKQKGSDKELEGRIESIQGSTLIIGGRTVTIGSATVIRHGDTAMTASQLQVGMRVHVKGTSSTTTGTTAAATAPMAATLIIVQNMNTNIPVNLNGTVSGLTGTASAFEFKVDGHTVKGTGATQFKGGKSPSFAGLANGDKVHVNGKQQNGFVQAESITLQGK